MTDWSIWTFQFAEGRLPLDFVRGAPVASNQGTTPVPMIFSLLQSSGGERILVDTGFASGASMTGPGFKDFVRSDEILARHGGLRQGSAQHDRIQDAQIHALAGQRVHGVRGIPDQREARGGVLRGLEAAQRKARARRAG